MTALLATLLLACSGSTTALDQPASPPLDRIDQATLDQYTQPIGGSTRGGTIGVFVPPVPPGEGAPPAAPEAVGGPAPALLPAEGATPPAEAAEAPSGGSPPAEPAAPVAPP